jgi:APA family basic amino acid/polyamine antiporter
MKNWNVKKTIVSREEMPEHQRLEQTLHWGHLIALGVGAIVGTGILTLIGVGAAKAGPAVMLSFAIAGLFLRRLRRASGVDRRLVADPRI